MKWINRGHELDAIGQECLKKKRLFVWGCGTYGEKMVKLLKWLGIDNELKITMVDSNSIFYGHEFKGFNVISPSVLFNELDSNTDILTISSENVYTQLKEIYDNKPVNDAFICYAEHLPNRDFLRRFLSVYLMYKLDKLLSPHTNYIITTRCNLNCKGCLNFNQYIQAPADESFESFKKHIDTVFTKFDWLASMHFSGGEVMLSKELKNCLSYISERYGDRIFELFYVTNGTVIPDKELLELMKRVNCGVLLDDYSHSVPLAKKNYPKVRQLFDEYGIWYNVAKADYWYDLQISDKEDGNKLTESELLERFNECNVHYFQDFFDGKISGCCYIGYTNDMYPNKARIYTPDPTNDYIEIDNCSKMEILEYRSGFIPKGYFDLCGRCSEMHGRRSVHIPVAQQLPRGE